jgi:hypothetical protein
LKSALRSDPFLTLGEVTALFLSCGVPTLFFASCETAATPVPVRLTRSKMQAITSAGDACNLRTRPMSVSFRRSYGRARS